MFKVVGKGGDYVGKNNSWAMQGFRATQKIKKYRSTVNFIDIKANGCCSFLIQ
jgi:hypothetical protein